MVQEVVPLEEYAKQVKAEMANDQMTLEEEFAAEIAQLKLRIEALIAAERKRLYPTEKT
jgi:hypothetical protein